jgi:hypothetical protein
MATETVVRGHSVYYHIQDRMKLDPDGGGC